MMFSRTSGTRRVLVLLTWLVATAPHRADSQELSEHEVKAAFVVNFAKFTEWPAGSFPGAATPIVIGVAGDETLRRALDHLAKGKLFAGRQLRIRNVEDARDASSTHLVFIGRFMGSRTADILKALNDLPVLTVGDADGFCAAGGMIAFLIERDRVRFEIRIDSTERASLKVSSGVLALAKTIYGKK
jgi:hypothetical protein